MLKKIRKFLKTHIKFSWMQIPMVLVFLISSILLYFIFSDSKSSLYETTARQITRIAKTSNNGQLTCNFYDPDKDFTADSAYLYKLVNDVRSLNRAEFGNYGTKGYKLRVVANGEGKNDYWFPVLNCTPAFIIQSTFSKAWNEKYLYENLNLNLMNETNNYGGSSDKHFFINESEAEYLVNNVPEFQGLTVSEVAGKSIDMHYRDENGVEQSEKWVISNIIIANELDDELYKSLYGSYAIVSHHLPAYKGKISITLDFSSGEIDNIHCVQDICKDYYFYKIIFETRNFNSPNTEELSNIAKIINSFGNTKDNDTRNVILGFVIVFVSSLVLFLIDLKYQVSLLTTLAIIILVFFAVYLVFMIGTYVCPFSFLDKSFNTFGIMSNVFLVIFANMIVILADDPHKSLKNQEEKKKDEG